LSNFTFLEGEENEEEDEEEEDVEEETEGRFRLSDCPLDILVPTVQQESTQKQKEITKQWRIGWKISS
jgi:hypothetical protein